MVYFIAFGITKLNLFSSFFFSYFLHQTIAEENSIEQLNGKKYQPKKFQFKREMEKYFLGCLTYHVGCFVLLFSNTRCHVNVEFYQITNRTVSNQYYSIYSPSLFYFTLDYISSFCYYLKRRLCHIMPCCNLELTKEMYEMNVHNRHHTHKNL